MPAIEDPRAPAPSSPCRPAATRATSGTAGHSGPENGQGPPSLLGPSKAPGAKTLGPTLPLVSAITSARPSARHTAGGSCLPASLGLTLTLGRSPRGTSQLVWRSNTGDWGPRSPSAGITLLPRRHPALGAPPVIQGGSTGRALRAPEDLRRPPRAKTLGPTLPLSSALTLAHPSARCTAGGSGLPAS